MKRVLLLSLLLIAPLYGQRGNRVSPPPQASCSRDHLTSFTGGVAEYGRTREVMRITVVTDWDTRERFTIRAPFKMLLNGRPFQEEDWKQVETSLSRLKPNIRVTLWVCDDGTQPLIDWNPVRE